MFADAPPPSVYMDRYQLISSLYIFLLKSFFPLWRCHVRPALIALIFKHLHLQAVIYFLGLDSSPIFAGLINVESHILISLISFLLCGFIFISCLMDISNAIFAGGNIIAINFLETLRGPLHALLPSSGTDIQQCSRIVRLLPAGWPQFSPTRLGRIQVVR